MIPEGHDAGVKSILIEIFFELFFRSFVCHLGFDHEDISCTLFSLLSVARVIDEKKKIKTVSNIATERAKSEVTRDVCLLEPLATKSKGNWRNEANA